MTPPRLAPQLPSLPPILHSICQNPTSNCSKGPRGLSVLLRETSIFTHTAISPSLWLRQYPSRYAIRAGRNFTFVRCFQRRRLSLHLSDREGRRLMESIDLSCDRDLHLGLSTSVVTGSKSSRSRLPTGLPFRCYGVLEAPHTRRASPLLADLSTGITPGSGNSITRQGISLP